MKTVYMELAKKFIWVFLLDFMDIFKVYATWGFDRRIKYEMNTQFSSVQ